MRGLEPQQSALFSYVALEARIPSDHPLRPVRALVDRALVTLSPTFDAIYADHGRPSIPPEQLLRALLLQVLYTVRSERQLMEQLDYNLLFRWFVGLGLDDTVWVPTVFTKNRDRLLEGDVAQQFFAAVLTEAKAAGLLSSEHFTVDGTLIQAWAGQKSFQRDLAKAPSNAARPGGDDDDERPQPTVPKHRRKFLPADDERRDDRRNPTVSFRGERRSNATHTSTTDPDAQLTKKAKGHEAKLGFHGHVLTENRSGLAVGAVVTVASGTAERETAITLVADAPYRQERITVGADKAYDTQQCVAALRAQGATPHVAQNDTATHPTAIDGRTTRHAGYAVSQRKRKRVEEIFGWLKTIGLLRQTRHRGVERVGWMFTFATAVYNLVRIRNLTAAAA
ncbi:MAG: IS5 family transposase [Gemmatimonadaceae bacterium]